MSLSSSDESAIFAVVVVGRATDAQGRELELVRPCLGRSRLPLTLSLQGRCRCMKLNDMIEKTKTKTENQRRK